MATQMRTVLALLALVTIVAGCDPTEPGQQERPLPLEGGPYTVEAVAHGGTIAGRCRLVGDVHPARLKAWPGMGTEAGQDDESVAVGSGQALGGCFVSVAGIAHGRDWPVAMRAESRALALAAVPGRYEPHLAWARVGTQVEVQSTLRMNISVQMLLGPSVLANFVVAPGTTQSPAAAFLEKPGWVHVTEDARRAFNAWILVSPHPYVEITSAQATSDREAGAYRLDAVPPGDYEVVCRHEPMDRRETQVGHGFVRYETGPVTEIRRRVHVGPGATATVDFELDGQPASSAETPPR